MSQEKICRWGILSTAGIARKNWQAIFHSGNGTLQAVASRSVEKAQQFIDECQADVRFPSAPEAVGDYEELLGRSDIDAVYIPLPTGIRKEWVIRAAKAGRHVLCEKPCAINAADLSEMIEACRANNVQFMDGVMYMHSRRMNALREVLDDGESIGEIRRIASQFSFCAPTDFLAENIRLHSNLEPAGCLGDLGWYTIRFTLWVLNYEMPSHVSARLISGASRSDSPDKVPTQFSAELFFKNDVTASFYNSFRTEHQQWAKVSGSKGHLTVDDFVLPYYGNELDFTVSNAHFNVQNTQMVMERHDRQIAVSEYSNNHATAQETRLFQRFGDLVLGGTPDEHWSDIALKTQRVLDACLESARSNGKDVSLG